MKNWDDLRLIQAIQAGGSMAAAARDLNVDYTTVFRRLNAIEAELDVRLFERSRTACVATPAGERLISAALDVQESVDAALLDVSGQDARLRGSIRVTTTPSLAQCVVIPLLDGFREAYPCVEVELIESYEVFDLMHREADVAMRFTRKPPENLVGIRVGEVGSAAFASAAYRDAHADVPIEDWDWIAPADESMTCAEAGWLKDNIDPERIRLRCNTGPAAARAVRAGLGVSILVAYLGVAEGLEQVGPLLPGLNDDVWLLTHPKLRSVARVHAFLQYMQQALRERLPELAGQLAA